MCPLQASIEAKYRELQDLAGIRRTRLTELNKLYEFYREADDVAIWIKDREVVASSEDYGTDVEHVQVIFGNSSLERVSGKLVNRICVGIPQ